MKPDFHPIIFVPGTFVPGTFVIVKTVKNGHKDSYKT